MKINRNSHCVASYILTSWYTISTGSKLTETPKSASQFNGCFSKSIARKFDDVLPGIKNKLSLN